MAKKFPTLNVVEQSSRQMFSFPKGITITLCMFAALVVLVVAVFSLIFSGTDMATLEAILNGDTGAFPAANSDASAGAALSVLFGILSFFVAYAWVFNMWIRFGAFGADGAFFESVTQGIGAAVITALKLFFISILLGIVGLVFMLILAAFGLVSLETAGALNTSVTDIMMSNLISIGVISGVYSLFSSNLTQTALGTDAEEIGPPHVFEFGLVLFALNAVLLIPLALLQLVLPVWFVFILQFVGGFWLTAAIPLAHGIRYDWQRQVFAGETAAQQFNLSANDQQQPDDEENS